MESLAWLNEGRSDWACATDRVALSKKSMQRP